MNRDQVKMIYPGCFDADAPEFKRCCSRCFNYPCGASDFCDKAKKFCQSSREAGNKGDSGMKKSLPLNFCSPNKERKDGNN